MWVTFSRIKILKVTNVQQSENVKFICFYPVNSVFTASLAVTWYFLNYHKWILGKKKKMCNFKIRRLDWFQPLKCWLDQRDTKTTKFMIRKKVKYNRCVHELDCEVCFTSRQWYLFGFKFISKTVNWCFLMFRHSP